MLRDELSLRPGLLHFEDADGQGVARLSRWLGKSPLQEPLEVADRGEATARAGGHDVWMGATFLTWHRNGHCVIEDLTAHLDDCEASDFMALCGSGRLVFTSLNEALSSARLVVIEGGQPLRDFAAWPEDLEPERNEGRLPQEATQPIASWEDVAALADREAERYAPAPGQRLLMLVYPFQPLAPYRMP